MATTASRFIVDSDNDQGGFRVPALIVEDSTGMPVGPVVSLQRVNLNNAFVDRPVVLFREGGNYLLLRTSGSALKIGRTLYFPLADCAGDPIIELGGGMPVADVSYAVGPGNVLYRGDGGFMSIDHASQTNAAAGADTTCLNSPGTSTPGHATTVALDFDDLYTGPFKLR